MAAAALGSLGDGEGNGLPGPGRLDHLVHHAEHEREAGGLDRARELGVVDEVIEPSRTREAIARAISEAPQRQGSHGNIPL